MPNNINSSQLLDQIMIDSGPINWNPLNLFSDNDIKNIRKRLRNFGINIDLVE